MAPVQIECRQAGACCGDRVEEAWPQARGGSKLRFAVVADEEDRKEASMDREELSASGGKEGGSGWWID